MSHFWISVGICLISTGLLASGIANGIMPGSTMDFDRNTYPIGYWATGALYAACAVGAFYLIVIDML